MITVLLDHRHGWVGSGSWTGFFVAVVIVLVAYHIFWRLLERRHRR